MREIAQASTIIWKVRIRRINCVLLKKNNNKASAQIY